MSTIISHCTDGETGWQKLMMHLMKLLFNIMFQLNKIKTEIQCWFIKYNEMYFKRRNCMSFDCKSYPSTQK